MVKRTDAEGQSEGPKPLRKQMYGTFHTIVQKLKIMFVGREEVIDTIAIALLCKQHAYFLSPPGTAKTAIIRAMAREIEMKFFGVQMREDTKPEEILGMWDLNELEGGKYCRKWGRMAKCQIAYVNEAFKGSSNALNAMLGILHEREVDDDNGYIPVPLWSAFLDSNELPRDRQALAAFFDRVLLKIPIDYLKEEKDVHQLLAGPDHAPGQVMGKFGEHELAALHESIRGIEVYEDYLDNIVELRLRLKLEGIVVSDRTLAEAAGLIDPLAEPRVTPVKAAAFYRGSRKVKKQDLLILTNVFWIDPAERPKIRKAILQVAMPELLAADKLIAELIDARTAALASNAVDTIVDARDLALDTRKKIKAMDIEDDLKETYITRTTAIFAELAERIQRV